MARRTLEKREAASRHARIHQMAAQQGRHLPDSMRAASAASLREAWRWALEPVGDSGETLVLFNHAGEGARDRDARDPPETEVRAAILHTSFGKGLFVAGKVTKGQHIGWYSGDRISLQQYNTLTEDTGRWHTLIAPGNMYINGRNSNTGMQYANSGRNSRPNNAEYITQSALL